MSGEKTTKELVEEQRTIVEGIRTKWEEMKDGIFTKGEAQAYEEKANTRFDELGKEIKKINFDEVTIRLDDIETKMKRPDNQPDNKDEKSLELKAYEKWLRFGNQVLTSEEIKTMKPGMAGKIDPEVLRSFGVPEEKVLTIGGASGVSYLAPGEYVNQIIKGVVEISPMRSLADIKPTSNNYSEIPKRTGTLSGGWTGEIESRAEDTGLTYGMETIPNHEMYALVKVSQQALEDSAFNLESEITAECIETFAKLEGAAFVTGTSVKQPEGFTVNASVNKATVVFDASDAAIIVNGVLDLMFAPKTAYARNASLVGNRTQIAYLRKYKDSTSGLYYWQPDGQKGTPGTFNGSPIVEMPDMADPADGALSLAFGDFRRGYVISDRIQISIQRLAELYAESGQVGFLARKRVGGQVVLAEAIYVGVGQA